MTTAVNPRYQDRHVCSHCGTVVERWCKTLEDGHVVNTPTLFPVASLAWRPPATDCELVTRKDDLVLMVRLDYYCPACDVDLTSSQTRVLDGDLPAYCFYEVTELSA